ncbi:MAG: uridine kinase [Lachnospiraceae bacterium]|nr:uridine kinase [Lachnospiraceae bacterium]
MQNTIIIGIAGGSASGKTTVAARLKESFTNDLILICHDSYYLSHNDLPYEERCKINYDHPNAFDTERMISDIHQLKKGIPIQCPIYDYSIHNRSKEVIQISPAKVIVIEGILIFENESLRNLMDIKVFVDTDADIRFIRRMLRDINERARSIDSIVEQYTTTVKPMHDKFVEPSKRYADLIIPRGGQNEVAISMLINRVKSILET